MYMPRMNQIVLHHSSVCGKALLGNRWRGKNTSDAFISCANPERKTAELISPNEQYPPAMPAPHSFSKRYAMSYELRRVDRHNS